MQNTSQEKMTSQNTGYQQTILLIDDDRTLRAVLAMQLEQMGYRIIEATQGQEGYEILQQLSDEIDIIVLDREMPVMDGMEFIQTLKQDTRFDHIPAIMVTGSGQPSQISQGIEAGVFYYLVKPIHYDVLSTLVSSAMEEFARIKKLSSLLANQNDSFNLLTEADFVITTPQEAEHLSSMLADCYPDPLRVFTGLFGLMTNAIEHGNLGIGFEEKSRLLDKGTLAHEIKHRLLRAENIYKNITINYRKNDQSITVTITDQGKGFDWVSYLTINPDRALKGNGRGIALARIQSFDKLEYNATGNQVTATVFKK